MVLSYTFLWAFLCKDIVSDDGIITKEFLGVTVIALVPDMAEIVNGVGFALQNNIALSIEVGSSIAVQVCLLQMPILVALSEIFSSKFPSPDGKVSLVHRVISWTYPAHHCLSFAGQFAMVFSDIYLWSVLFSVVLMNYVCQQASHAMEEKTLPCSYFFLKIFMDGKSDYFQGTALMIVYVVLISMVRSFYVIVSYRLSH